MKEKETQDNTQPTLTDETQENVQSIASDIDFKPYLDVVNADSQRTRAVLFVLVAALLLIFTAYRNTAFPDWTEARLSRLQKASWCVENKVTDGDCEAARKYATDFLVQDPGRLPMEVGSSEELGRELKEQINAFLKQRTDALSLRLPFFGITIDMNDLGLSCGLLLTAILFVLYACLKSETDDLRLAWKKAGEMEEKKRDHNLTLLLMSQVLASPSKSRIGMGQGLYLLFVLVPLLQFFVVKSDVQDLAVAVALEGQRWARIDTAIDLAAFLLVIFCSLFCVTQQRKLNHTLDDLVHQMNPQLTNSRTAQDKALR